MRGLTDSAVGEAAAGAAEDVDLVEEDDVQLALVTLLRVLLRGSCSPHHTQPGKYGTMCS